MLFCFGRIFKVEPDLVVDQAEGLDQEDCLLKLGFYFSFEFLVADW